MGKVIVFTEISDARMSEADKKQKKTIVENIQKQAAGELENFKQYWEEEYKLLVQIQKNHPDIVLAEGKYERKADDGYKKSLEQLRKLDAPLAKKYEDARKRADDAAKEFEKKFDQLIKPYKLPKDSVGNEKLNEGDIYRKLRHEAYKEETAPKNQPAAQLDHAIKNAIAGLSADSIVPGNSSDLNAVPNLRSGQYTGKT